MGVPPPFRARMPGTVIFMLCPFSPPRSGESVRRKPLPEGRLLFVVRAAGGGPRLASRSGIEGRAGSRSSRSFRGSEWRVVLHASRHGLDLVDEVVEVPFAMDEIDLRRV